MEGWILYNNIADPENPDIYELRRYKEAAARRSINIRIIRPDMIEFIIDNHERDYVLIDGERCPLPDFFIPRMGALATPPVLSIIRQFENLGIVTVNNSSSIDLSHNKLSTLQILARNHIPVPKTVFFHQPFSIDRIASILGYPLIVKTIWGSQGDGVYLCENKTEFDTIARFIHAVKTDIPFLAQKFIETSRGRDIRVYVVGNKAVGAIERTAPEGQFKTNITHGAAGKSIALSEEIKTIAVSSASLLGLEIAGIDLLYDGDGLCVCEVNSTPGFLGFEGCHPEISIPDVVLNYIQSRL